MTEKISISTKIISGIIILLSGFFTYIGLTEFYIVGIKKETELYPFGGEGPVPYFYKSAELYSAVSLTYGLIFGILLGLGIWNLMNNKSKEILLLGLTVLMIFIQIYHGWAK